VPELRERTHEIEKLILEKENEEFNFGIIVVFMLGLFIFGVTIVSNEHHYLH
jgi:hypothetical protein